MSKKIKEKKASQALDFLIWKIKELWIIRDFSKLWKDQDANLLTNK